jgi:hypothetical protein
MKTIFWELFFFGNKRSFKKIFDNKTQEFEK